MRIGAHQNPSFLEFTPLPELSSHSFDLLASVEGRQVHVDSLALLATASFLRELSMLRARWSGAATLTGTYDFCLQVRAIRPEQLWLSVYAVDYIATIGTGDPPCARHILDAGFPLYDAAAVRLFEQFEELFPQ